MSLEEVIQDPILLAFNTTLSVPLCLQYLKTHITSQLLCHYTGPNTGKYGPEKTPYLDTFHTVLNVIKATMVTRFGFRIGSSYIYLFKVGQLKGFRLVSTLPSFGS